MASIEVLPLHREVVHGILKRFRETVLPRGPELKKGVIHGDINEQNLLMHPEKPEVRNDGVAGFC